VEPNVADRIDVANLWRVESIIRLGLTGSKRTAAASPGPAFPQLVNFLVRNIDEASEGIVIDVGAGLGGISETLRRTTRRQMIVLDEAPEACDGAHRLFPALLVVAARSSALPIGDASIAAAVSCGGLSSTERSDLLIGEVRRVLRPSGVFVALDLASSTAEDVTIGRSVYRGSERVLEQLRAVGFEVRDLATAHTSVGDWALADEDVVREISRARRGDRSFERWVDDRRHLQRVMDSGRVLMTGLAMELPPG
jgi:SAM-dependent methyltransferase